MANSLKVLFPGPGHCMLASMNCGPKPVCVQSPQYAYTRVPIEIFLYHRSPNSCANGCIVGNLLRHLGIPLLLLRLALRLFGLHLSALLVELLLGLLVDLLLYLCGRSGRDVFAEPDASPASLGEHLSGGGITVQGDCLHFLAARRHRGYRERR